MKLKLLDYSMKAFTMLSGLLIGILMALILMIYVTSGFTFSNSLTFYIQKSLVDFLTF